jgi:hypothetical protein
LAAQSLSEAQRYTSLSASFWRSKARIFSVARFDACEAISSMALRRCASHSPALRADVFVVSFVPEGALNE